MQKLKLTFTALTLAASLAALTGCRDNGSDHFIGEWLGTNDRGTINLDISSHERGLRIRETSSFSDREMSYFVEPISDTELINGGGDDRIRFTYNTDSDTITEASSFMSNRLETTYERQ